MEPQVEWFINQDYVTTKERNGKVAFKRGYEVTYLRK